MNDENKEFFKIEKRFITSEKDIKLFTEFYNGIFTETFTNKDEYESLDYISSLIREGYFNTKTSCIALYLKNNEIIAGLVYYKFTYSNVISFLVVKKELRKKGIGRKILNDFLKDMKTATFVEVEKDNERGLSFWKNNDFRVINFDYKQPNFDNKNEVSLNLCIKANMLSKLINKNYLKDFIYQYSKIAMGIKNPRINKTVQSMFKKIDKRECIEILDNEEETYLL
jgi:hypothetical protein